MLEFQPYYVHSGSYKNLQVGLCIIEETLEREVKKEEEETSRQKREQEEKGRRRKEVCVRACKTSLLASPSFVSIAP